MRSFLFVEEDNVTSYADDTTPYSNGKNVVTVLENIETKGKEVFNWFSMNYLKANPGKSQLLLTSKDEASIKIADTDIKSSSSKKLLGVLIDNMFLSFAKKLFFSVRILSLNLNVPQSNSKQQNK